MQRKRRSWFDEHDIAWVKTEGISIDGLVIGKHLSTRKFVSSLPLGNAITEFVLGYDIGGTPFPRVVGRLAPRSARRLPSTT